MKHFISAWLSFVLASVHLRITHGGHALEIALCRSDLPFQRRLLAPLATYTVTRYTSLGWQAAEFVIVWSALFAVLVSWAQILQELYGLDDKQATLAPFALAGLLVPGLCGVFGYKSIDGGLIAHPRTIYDVVHLLFATGLIACSIRGQWGIWLAFLAVGTLNRETTLFYILPALFIAIRSKRGVAFVILGGLVWAAEKMLLQVLFPGPPGYLHVVINLAYLTGTRGLPDLLTLAFCLAPLALLLRAVQRMPKGLALHLLVIPQLLLVMLLFGQLREGRLYIEVGLLILPALFLTSQISCKKRE